MMNKISHPEGMTALWILIPIIFDSEGVAEISNLFEIKFTSNRYSLNNQIDHPIGMKYL